MKFQLMQFCRITIAAIFMLLTISSFAAERQITVAASGGDFTTIQDALSAITPTASNPYVIDVMPGTYYLIEVPLKSYVHIRGAGSDVTKLYSYSSPAANALVLNNVTNVEISGVKIYGSGGVNGGFGFGLNIVDSSSISIRDSVFENLYSPIFIERGAKHTIQNNVFTNCNYCVRYRNATPIISDNQFTNAIWVAINGMGAGILRDNTITGSAKGITAYGASQSDSAPLTVIGNVIKANNGDAITVEYSYYAGVTIENNVITNNSGYGISVSNSANTIILHNRITNNGTDIGVFSSTVNRSFNVYDTVSGWGVLKGGYNLNSNGDPANTL